MKGKMKNENTENEVGRFEICGAPDREVVPAGDNIRLAIPTAE